MAAAFELTELYRSAKGKKAAETAVEDPEPPVGSPEKSEKK